MATNNEFDRQSVNDAFADRLTSEIAAVPDNLDLPANAIPARPEAVQVAQAGTPAQPQTVVVELAEGNIARLPEGADISEPRQNGTDLEFVQPDGTVIVIPNGAVQGLTLFIGAVEIPPQAVAQLFTTNGIEAAAGPDAGPAQGSHGNFQDNVGGQGIGDGIGFSSLLGNTDLNFGTGDTQSEQGNLPPNLFGATYSASLAEDALLNGNPEGGEVRVITGVVAASDVDQLTYGFTAPAGEFTSHGVAIVWSIEPGTGDLVGMAGDTLIIRAHIERTADNNGAYTITLSGPIDHPAGAGENNVAMNLGIVVSDGFNTSETTLTLTIGDDMPISTEPTAGTVEEAGLVPGGYEGEEGAHSNVLNGDLHLAFGADGPAANAAVVLAADGATWQQTTSTTGILTGADDAWTLEVHADGTYTFTLLKPLDHSGEGNGEAINIGISVTATDFDGDSATSNFAVTVNDDVPFAGESTNGQLSETTNSGFSNAFVTQTLADQSLNIHWGADSANAGGSYDRAVTFATTTAPEGLTSNGFQVIYVVSEDGTTITAYRVTMGENPLTHEPEQHFVSTGGGDLGPNPSNSARVFSVQLSDTGNGTYTFTLYDNLDHPEGNGSVSLDFNFVAKDADGDTAGGQFQIGIEDTVPEVVGEAQIVTVSEAQLTDGQSGALNIDWNADDGAAKHINFAAEGLPQGLKSDGVDIVYQVQQDAAGNDVLVAYKEGGSPDNPVFMVAFTEGNPTYTFTLFQNLDHPAGSDTLELNFGIVATDGDGDTVTQDFTVNVADDKPVAGEATTGAVNEDDISSWPQTDGTPFSDAGKSTTQALNISWGADDDIRTGAGDTFGRSVGFSTNAGVVSAQTFTDAALAGLSVSGGTLTSNGVALVYQVVNTANGGQILTAYKGEVGGDVIFKVTLDPTSTSGSYKFDLVGELDHAANSDSATLTFGFRGADADGDSTGKSSFMVTIADDKPVIGSQHTGVVDEDGFPQLESGAGNPGPIFGGGDEFLAGTIDSHSLAISWGADDGSNRSVTFNTAAISAPADLTSNGIAVVYEYSAGNTMLTAYRFDGTNYIGADGEVLTAAGKAGAAVFTVGLSESGSGSYTFILLDNIDQARGGEENNTVLNFGFTATDADGDAVSSSFNVSIDDDTPVVLINQPVAVDEGDIGSADAAQTGALGIYWGSDLGNSVVDGGNTGLDGDRAVVFGQNNAPSWLTSNGAHVRYEVGENGTLLTAYRFENGHYVGPNGEDLGTSPADAARVFTVTLSDTGSGSYTFTLLDNIDSHGASDSLGFNFTAIDGDGDGVNSSFVVVVLDDSPSLGGATNASVDEDGLNGNPGAPAPYAGSDLAGEATNTGAVSLGINWGADADLKSEALTPGGNIGTVDDPIGRTVEFVRASGSAQTLGVGVVNAAQLGAGFADLKSDGVGLDYRIDYMLDSQGHWNGGYVLTAYKDGTDASVEANQVFKLTLDPTATNGSYTFDLLGNLDHPVANQEDDLQLTFSFRAGDSDGDKTGRGSFTVTVDDDAPVIHEASAAVNLLTNGDFSNGSWPHAESWGAWATEATGWKITGTGTVQLERVEDNYLGMSSSTHGQMVDLGSTAGNITISQSIAGLATDKPYTLTFEIGSPDTASSKLEVYWNGHLVGTFVPTGTMTTMTIADLLPDAQGHGVISFKEVGTPDNTGTYLANVGLAPSDMVSAPVIYGTIGEDEGNATVVLTEGSSYSFGADGAGSVAFDKDATVITTPTGTTLAVPDLIYDAATGTLTVAPGSGFNGLSEGEIATLSIPFTVTDGDGDTTTGIYQLTVVGKNDAVTTSKAFPDGGTITEYDETNPAANSTDDRTVFDAEPGHAGYNGGAFYIYDDQGDSHTLSITSPSGALGYLTASVSEETVNDGVGLVTWHYHISDADLNPLQAGETRTEVFQVTVDDGHGSQTTRDITITLVGTNDTPVISVEQGNSDYVFLTETDAGQQANGTLSVADADVKDAVTATVLGVTASGSGIENLFTEAQLLEFFKVGTNPVIDGTHTAGDISWTFDSNGEAFNFLPKGWESVLSYTIQVDDGHGGTDTHVVQIKLHGTNDLPVVDLNGDAAGQDATVTAVEQLDQWIFSGAKISDADTGNLHSMTVAFAARPDGSAEVLSFNTAASTALAAAGLMVFTTIDGGLVISGDASVATYQMVLNAIIYNNDSDNPTSGGRELTVVVNDGMDDSVAHTTTVSVIPLNDKPIFAGTMHAEVAEGGTHTLTLAELGFSDPDDNAGGVAFKIVNATHGRVLLDGILSESFTAQAVIDGRVTFEHDGSEGNSAGFTVTVEDGNEDGSPAVQGEFTFSVDPVNDAPEATALTGSVGEDGPSYSQDLLASASDPDGDALSVQDVATSVTTSGLRTLLLGTDYTVTNGVFALTAEGFAKFNALNDGESDELTITYKISDGQAQTSNSLTVTIVGANEVVVTNPPTVDDATSAAGRYAFVKDYMSPNAINFDLANLFGGGAGALTYTLEKVYTSNDDDWLKHNGDTVSGNPANYPFSSHWDDDGMYMYKVTATDVSGHQVSTYVAFNAIEDSGRIYDLTDNGKGNDNGVGWANDHNGDGDLILIGDNINKVVKAGDGDDVVIGSSVGDDIRGGTGDDAVYAQDGNDTIYGDDGNDFLDGGNGNDTIHGGTGHDILLGGNGDDFLYGEDGNDILLGGAGNDRLDGGSGDDLLIGGAGSDTLKGGEGVDTFKFQPGDLTGGAVDYISDFRTGSNGDIIDLSELLSGASGNKADLVRFEYANEATELLSHSGSAPGVNGDVTLQVNVSGTWTDVATIHDNGGNLTSGDDIIRILLDSTVITHNI